MSSLAAFVASHLQQSGSAPAVQHILHQWSVLNCVQRVGSLSKFIKPKTGKHEISVLFFSDAARPHKSAQLGFMGGVIVGKVEDKSPFYTISWASHLSKRPVKSSASAEVLAAGAAVEEELLIVGELSQT